MEVCITISRRSYSTELPVRTVCGRTMPRLSNVQSQT